MAQLISRETLDCWLRESRPITLLQVDSQEDFARAHLPGSVHRTLPVLTSEDPELAFPDKARPMVLYSQDPADPNARRAASFLEELGYRSVWLYEGGMDDWLENGMPIESDEFEARRSA